MDADNAKSRRKLVELTSHDLPIVANRALEKGMSIPQELFLVTETNESEITSVASLADMIRLYVIIKKLTYGPIPQIFYTDDPLDKVLDCNVIHERQLVHRLNEKFKLNARIALADDIPKCVREMQFRTTRELRDFFDALEMIDKAKVTFTLKEVVDLVNIYLERYKRHILDVRNPVVLHIQETPLEELTGNRLFSVFEWSPLLKNHLLARISDVRGFEGFLDPFSNLPSLNSTEFR